MKEEKWNRWKVIMNHGCIVHYPNQKHSSALKKLSEIKKEKISDAKEKRINLEGNLHNESRCKSIPNNIFVNSHRIHFDPY